MPHIKFDPMKELDYLSERMKRFAQEFPETFSFEMGKGFEPRIDLLHDDTHVIVTVELPGLQKRDVRLSVADGVLTISGEKAAPNLEQTTQVRMERSYGSFSRAIELPAEIDRNAIGATMSDGVLEVRLQKSAAAENKSINIEIK